MQVQPLLVRAALLATVLVFAVLLSLLAFKLSPESASFGVCRGCNVVIIGVDTLRADHVHAVGYGRLTTPNIDALAQKGFLFTQAIAPASWTVPSFMSVMTGAYPSVHGVVNKYVVFTKDQQKLSNLSQTAPSMRTLAQVLKASGFSTGGFTGDAGVSGKFGYNQGFDAYTDERAFGGFDNSEEHAFQWLDSIRGRRFFMFLHGYDLHGMFKSTSRSPFIDPMYRGPYTGSPQEEAILREQVLTPQGVHLSRQDAALWRDVYDGKVMEADGQVGSFIAKLSSRGLLDNTLIVIVADHGEEFNEHGGFDHGQSLYDELIHVPLIFVVPHMKGGVVIPAQVGTLDVAPTILHLLGIRFDAKLSTQFAGHDLSPYFANPKKSGEIVYSETDYRGYTHKRSVRTPEGFKYIVTLESGREELYDLTTDPGETKNLILSNLQEAEALRTLLRTHIREDLKQDPSQKAEVTCLPVYDSENKDCAK